MALRITNSIRNSGSNSFLARKHKDGICGARRTTYNHSGARQFTSLISFDHLAPFWMLQFVLPAQKACKLRAIPSPRSVIENDPCFVKLFRRFCCNRQRLLDWRDIEEAAAEIERTPEVQRTATFLIRERPGLLAGSSRRTAPWRRLRGMETVRARATETPPCSICSRHQPRREKRAKPRAKAAVPRTAAWER